MRLQASQMDVDSFRGEHSPSFGIHQPGTPTQPRILLETAALHLMNGKAVPSSKVAEMLQLAKAELKKVPLVPTVQASSPEQTMAAGNSKRSGGAGRPGIGSFSLDSGRAGNRRGGNFMRTDSTRKVWDRIVDSRGAGCGCQLDYGGQHQPNRIFTGTANCRFW